MGNIFEYQGYHFMPIARLNDKQRELRAISPYLISDQELGINNYEWGKHDYSHKSFYIAGGIPDYDLFQCLENGKVYIPCANELFQYTGRVQELEVKHTIQLALMTSKIKDPHIEFVEFVVSKRITKQTLVDIILYRKDKAEWELEENCEDVETDDNAYFEFVMTQACAEIFETHDLPDCETNWKRVEPFDIHEKDILDIRRDKQYDVTFSITGGIRVSAKDPKEASEKTSKMSDEELKQYVDEAISSIGFVFGDINEVM